MMNHQSNFESLHDFCDGNYYKRHELFSSDKPAIQLLLYYDELEVCNPLGSKRTKHKLGKILREEIFPLSLFKGAFYFNIGNVHPKFRQRLSNIKLLALTKSAIINEHGINEVMKCIVEDIKKLENVS